MFQCKGHCRGVERQLTKLCVKKLDISLTVNAATLIFISWSGWLFHLLRKGNQVLFIMCGKE